MNAYAKLAVAAAAVLIVAVVGYNLLRDEVCRKSHFDAVCLQSGRLAPNYPQAQIGFHAFHLAAANGALPPRFDLLHPIGGSSGPKPRASPHDRVWPRSTPSTSRPANRSNAGRHGTT